MVMKRRIGIMFVLAMTVILLAGCAESESADEGKLQVATTIAQIGQPLEVIGGDRVQVRSLMGPGVDPHLYNATQSDIRTLENADVIFYNGLFLEGNMVDIFDEIRKNKPVLAVTEVIPEQNLLIDEDGALDPHVWFDIDLWQQALDAAVELMKQLRPEDADYFETNKQRYFEQLQNLKEETKKLAEIPAEQRVLVTAHDAFGYFGRMHQIEVVGLQGLSTEDEVSLTEIQATIELLIERGIPAVFVESSINERSIQAVIEGAAKANHEVRLGGELYSDAMGEAGTEEGTYIGMYRHNVNTIYEALKGAKNE